MAGKIICWDLDWTLGYFEPLISKYTDEEYPLCGDLPVSIRPGIRDTLSRLSEAGYAHAVTTFADRKSAETALIGTGLRKHFDAIFGHETNNKVNGKAYRPVADYFGFSPADAPERMIVTGDACGDIPLDIGIVFIEHAKGVLCLAKLIEDLLEILLERGNSHFKRGFDSIYQSIAASQASDKPVVTVKFNEMVSAALEYKTPFLAESRDLSIPVIRVIDPTGYERGLQRVW